MKWNRDQDLDAVLADWRDATPPIGFSSRVLAAVDGPRPTAAPSRAWKSWFVAAAACACLAFAAVLFFGTYETATNAVVAAAQEPDLGLQRD